MCEFIIKTYFWPMFYYNIKAYIKDYDICLSSKTVRHKLYNKLQSIPIFTHQWKNLSINFVISFPISTNWKDISYELILVIVNYLKKIVYYKLVKVIINITGLLKVIIHVVIWEHDLPELTISDRDSLFRSKFWSLLCYLFKIKEKLFIAFFPQIDR